MRTVDSSRPKQRLQQVGRAIRGQEEVNPWPTRKHQASKHRKGVLDKIKFQGVRRVESRISLGAGRAGFLKFRPKQFSVLPHDLFRLDGRRIVFRGGRCRERRFRIAGRTGSR